MGRRIRRRPRRTRWHSHYQQPPHRTSSSAACHLAGGWHGREEVEQVEVEAEEGRGEPEDWLWKPSTSSSGARPPRLSSTSASACQGHHLFPRTVFASASAGSSRAQTLLIHFDFTYLSSIAAIGCCSIHLAGPQSVHLNWIHRIKDRICRYCSWQREVELWYSSATNNYDFMICFIFFAATFSTCAHMYEEKFLICICSVIVHHR